jgi:micrococcal nuclease
MPMNHEGPVIIVPENPGSATIRAPALKVFDGDGFLTKIKTYQLTGDQRDQVEFEATVRFGFIDAPELEQPGGHEAKEFLTSLIGGKWIELVVLTKIDTGRAVDRYRRIVCVPFLTEEYTAGEFRTPSNSLHQVKKFGEPLFVTRNIELEMVINGWAWVLERYGPDQRYLEALEDARLHQRGIWALKENIHPWEFKKQKYRATRPRLMVDVGSRDQCPMDGCGGRLVRRNGKFGAFFGCSNFPACKYSRPVER